MLKSTKLLAAAAALCLAIPGTVLADGPRVLKIGFILAQQSQLGAGTAAFAAEIEKSSGGKFKIEQYPGAVLGDEVAMIKGLQLGTIDLAFITGAPLPSVVKEMGVLSIPFIFRDAQHAHAVLDGPIGTDLVAKFAPKGLVALAWGENGMRQITSAKRAIATPEDLKGLKLRVPQNEVTVAGFKALGADAAPLGFSDLYGALQTGKFDAQENPIATIVATKFYQVQKYLTVSNHQYDPALFFATPDLWEDLSEADRAMFVKAAKIGGEASRKFAAEAQASGVATLEKEGMTVVKSIDRAKFSAALAPAMPAYDQMFGADLIAKIRNYE
jgi:tripartite ATP-independent transporter DctP family solute receptor